jgi:protein-S-isoprenylcysteine O-methyltransferase Ste14
MPFDFRRTPNIVPWPPLIYLSVATIALLLHRVAPWRLLSGADGHIPGIFLAGCGFALDVWAMFVMMNARVNILPHRPAGGLVSWGPFAFTRNPIYLGNTIAIFGIGVAFSGWFLLAAPLAAIIVHHLAILREEEHLKSRFGIAWVAYSSRVPRWIGVPGIK